MRRLFRRLGQITISVALTGVGLVIGLLIGWATWHTRWTVLRFMVAFVAAYAVWRFAKFAQKHFPIVRAVTAAATGMLVYVVLAGDDIPGRPSDVIALVVLLLLTATLFLPRIPAFFSPKPATAPDVRLERRSPLEFTSDDGPRLVDALDDIWGSTRRSGERFRRRAVHTHGTIVNASFEVADADAPCSRHIPFLARPCSAIVRFSNFSGSVDRDDRRREPHGMAVKLVSEGDGDDAAAGIDLVCIDIDRFMVSTREDFYAFTHAFSRPMLDRLRRWTWMILTGRTTLKAIVGMRVDATTSYLDRTYHGLNTVNWTVHQPGVGRPVSTPVRYRITPTHPRGDPVDDDHPDRLDAEVHDRLEHMTPNEPIRFQIELVDGTGIDPELVKDPRVPWPQDQPAFLLGLLTVRNTPANHRLERAVFDPHRMCRGVRPSDDEILMARRAAYPESHLRRTRR